MLKILVFSSNLNGRWGRSRNEKMRSEVRKETKKVDAKKGGDEERRRRGKDETRKGETRT